MVKMAGFLSRWNWANLGDVCKDLLQWFSSWEGTLGT
jgi:hypothetical protein